MCSPTKYPPELKSIEISKWQILKTECYCTLVWALIICIIYGYRSLGQKYILYNAPREFIPISMNGRSVQNDRISPTLLNKRANHILSSHHCCCCSVATKADALFLQKKHLHNTESHILWQTSYPELMPNELTFLKRVFAWVQTVSPKA